MRPLTQFAISLLLVAVCLSACAAPRLQATATPEPQATSPQSGLANPASVNCEQKGGKLEMRDRGDLGTYGVCVFEENRQCEEWAMFRGECPAGGVDVTSYATDAAVFCAISGGEYTATDNIGKADELGTCALKDGTTHDAWDLFNGSSPKK